MKKKLKLAIVGRPNVGKSALFNRICKRRLAIVDEAEGITRDRLYADADCFGKPFEVIDTGGIDARSTALFNDEVKRQAEIAIEEADALMMVVDSRIGLTDLDQELARILLRSGKQLVLAVNKVDHRGQEELLHNFHSLGIETMIPVSAIQGHGIAEVLEAALDDLEASDVEEEGSIRVAIVGRPNVGKSTLVNTLLDDERCIVSPIAGTTRDSIDIAFEIDGQRYTLIDTAGIRKKKSEHEVVDKFAAIRTARAIEKADLCILLCDAEQGFSTQDKRIASQIEKEGKPCLVFANKWDRIDGFRMEHVEQAMRSELPFLSHCPIIFGSALTGRNCPKLIEKGHEIYQEGCKRVPTSQLNKFIESSLHELHPPMIQGKRLRIYYMTQIQSQPPRFLLFINSPHLIAPSYLRYLQNRFRRVFGFEGNPIFFHLRGKQAEERQRKKEISHATA